MAVRLPGWECFDRWHVEFRTLFIFFHPYLLIFLVEISCPRNKYLAAWQDNHTDKWMQWFRGWHQRSLQSGKGYSPICSCCLTGFELFLFVCCRDSYGFITYRYTCDAFAALENGYTLRRSNETDFELYFCGRKQFFKSNYADLGMDFTVHRMRNP